MHSKTDYRFVSWFGVVGRYIGKPTKIRKWNVQIFSNKNVYPKLNTLVDNSGLMRVIRALQIRGSVTLYWKKTLSHLEKHTKALPKVFQNTYVKLFGQCLFDCGLNIGLRVFENSLMQKLQQFILNNIMLTGHKWLRNVWEKIRLGGKFEKFSNLSC